MTIDKDTQPDVDSGTEIVNDTADEVTQIEPGVESEARSMGWVPEEEWRGDPPKHGFVSAEEFVENGRKVLPIVTAENRRMKEELKELKDSLQNVQDTTKKFRKFAEQAIERERAQRQQALEQLERERADAISNSDGEAAVRAEREIHRLQREQASHPPEQTPNLEAQSEINDWMSKNQWYVKDADLQAYADGLAARIRSENPTLRGRPFLDRLAETVRQRMPERFENPRASQPSAVEGARRGNPRPSRKKGFDDLPPDAKREYEQFKRSMPDFSKEEYVKLYEWE